MGRKKAAKPNAQKRWTREEEQYLGEAWGRTSLKGIAKNLGRTETAVAVKVQRMGLGPALQAGERISWNEFVKGLYGGNYGGDYVKKRLIKAGFPVHIQTVRGKNGARFTTVDIDEFWEFAERHKDLFDFSRMEPHIFGMEPEWAALKRQLDAERRRNVHAYNDAWTKSEDNMLIHLLQEYKYTYTDIAKKLRRSEGAVKRRIATLGLKERPVRKETRMWTDEEMARLVEMRAQGYGYDNIAAKLGRSELCVRRKYERLLNPEYLRTRNKADYIRVREADPGDIMLKGGEGRETG